VLRFPTEIESDLLDENRRIGEWHTYPAYFKNGSFVGRMSSRELLVILAHLPSDSEFKKAVSFDGWSDNERVANATANWLSDLLRATTLAFGGEDYQAPKFLSPLERRELALEETELDETRDDLMDQMYRGGG
jgi:hypothetical protein